MKLIIMYFILSSLVLLCLAGSCERLNSFDTCMVTCAKVQKCRYNLHRREMECKRFVELEVFETCFNQCAGTERH